MNYEKETEKLDATERAAIEEYESVLGRVILAPVLYGYVGNDCREFYCDPPARVRVVKTEQDAILHWNDSDYLDPYWDVELVSPHPEIPKDAGSLWFDGTTFCKGVREPVRYTLEPESTWNRAFRQLCKLLKIK